ncbi:MAG: sugar transferase [Bacteroidetes bacterium]|nr:sugar transferase [Bacteroidota bacterium]
MNIVQKHTAIQSLPVKWQAQQSNGIVRSFVASRKEFLVAKRSFDIVFSLLIIILILSWLTPLVALLIRLNSKGPVFFRQRRIGRNGVPFHCYKFRTMVVNAEADEVPAEEEDERITRIGSFLRRTNLDELPQFFNVLKGDMSIIGPRPHMVADCIRFSFVVSSYSFRHLVRPGITGWAQANGFHGPTSDYESIIIRYYWDAMYVRKAGIGLDIKIFWVTCKNMVANIFRAFLRKKSEK